MTALLREHAFRLRRDRGFWILFAITFALAFANVFFNAEMSGAAAYGMLGRDVVFSFIPELGLFCASAVGATIADEHQHGGPASRVMAGYRRSQIYMAALIASIWQCVLLALACIGAGLACISTFGPLDMPWIEACGVMVLVLLSACSYAALFTLLSTLLTDRSRGLAVPLIVTIGTAIGMLMLTSFIASALSEPALTDGWDVLPDGTVVTLPVTNNPAYVGGTARTVLETLQYALPGGQDVMLSRGDISAYPFAMAAWDVGLTAVLGAVGTLVFRRKDLK